MQCCSAPVLILLLYPVCCAEKKKTGFLRGGSVGHKPHKESSRIESITVASCEMSLFPQEAYYREGTAFAFASHALPSPSFMARRS